MSRTKRSTSLLLILSLFVSGILSYHNAFATDLPDDFSPWGRDVGAIIKNIRFNYKGSAGEVSDPKNGVPKIERWVEFQINIDWDLSAFGDGSSPGEGIKNGDHLTISFPGTIDLTPVTGHDSGISLEKRIGDKNYIIGKLYLRTQNDRIGTENGEPLKKLIVVFGEDVEKLKDINGTFKVYGSFSYPSDVKVNENNTFVIHVSGREDITKTYYLNYSPKKVTDEIISHWEALSLSSRLDRSVGLYARINAARIDLQGSTIISRIGSTGSRFDKDRGIEFKYQDLNEYGERVGNKADTMTLVEGTDYRVEYRSQDKEMRIHILSDALNGGSAALIYRILHNPGIDYIENPIRIEKNDLLLPLPGQRGATGEQLRNAENIFVANELSGIKYDLSADRNEGLFRVTMGDDRGGALNGVAFRITRSGEEIDRIVTGSHNKGVAISKRLDPGEYLLEQTHVPEGYRLEATPTPITIRGGKYTDLDVVIQQDPSQGGTIRIIKTDAGDLPVEDAGFEIYSDTDRDNEPDDTHPIDRIRTDERGEAVSKRLAPGRYLLRETDLPEDAPYPVSDYRIDLKPNEEQTIRIRYQPILSDGSSDTDPKAPAPDDGAQDAGNDPQTDASPSAPSDTGSTTDAGSANGSTHPNAGTDDKDPNNTDDPTSGDDPGASGPSAGDPDPSDPTDKDDRRDPVWVHSSVRPDPAHTESGPSSSDHTKDLAEDPDRSRAIGQTLSDPDDTKEDPVTDPSIPKHEDLLPSDLGTAPDLLHKEVDSGSGDSEKTEKHSDASDDPEFSIGNEAIPRSDHQRKVRSGPVDAIDSSPKTGYDGAHSHLPALWIGILSLLILGSVLGNKDL